MNIKNRLLGSASVLALAGGLLVAAAPAAHAAVQSAGDCNGSLSLAKITNAAKTGGLTDTNQPITVAASTLKTVLTQSTAKGIVVGGTCTLDAAFGGASVTPTKVSTKLSGVASCATAGAGADPLATPPLPGEDPTGGNPLNQAYPLNGKLTIKEPGLNIPAAGQTQIATYVSLLGFSATAQDVVDIAGIVTKGDLVGAQVSGSLWEDPITKDVIGDQSSGAVFPGDDGVKKPFVAPTVAGAGQTDYSLGLTQLIGLGACADGNPGSLALPGITQVMVGDGPSLIKQLANSPFGVALGANQAALAGESNGSGIHFSFGE